MFDNTELLHGDSLDASLTVANLEHSATWYADVLGFSEDRRHQRDGKLIAVSLKAGVVRILRNLDAILQAVRGRLPRAVLLVANVYDPTDGSGDLEGHRLRPQEMRWLRDHNAGVDRLCGQRGARLIDVHGHFAGHGRSAPAAERWYWSGSLIEPGVVGASELRRLWLTALDESGA